MQTIYGTKVCGVKGFLEGYNLAEPGRFLSELERCLQWWKRRNSGSEKMLRILHLSSKPLFTNISSGPGGMSWLLALLSLAEKHVSVQKVELRGYWPPFRRYRKGKDIGMKYAKLLRNYHLYSCNRPISENRSNSLIFCQVKLRPRRFPRGP